MTREGAGRGGELLYSRYFFQVLFFLQFVCDDKSPPRHVIGFLDRATPAWLWPRLLGPECERQAAAREARAGGHRGCCVSGHRWAYVLRLLVSPGELKCWDI